MILHRGLRSLTILLIISAWSTSLSAQLPELQLPSSLSLSYGGDELDTENWRLESSLFFEDNWLAFFDFSRTITERNQELDAEEFPATNSWTIGIGDDPLKERSFTLSFDQWGSDDRDILTRGLAGSYVWAPQNWNFSFSAALRRLTIETEDQGDVATNYFQAGLHFTYSRWRPFLFRWGHTEFRYHEDMTALNSEGATQYLPLSSLTLATSFLDRISVVGVGWLGRKFFAELESTYSEGAVDQIKTWTYSSILGWVIHRSWDLEVEVGQSDSEFSGPSHFWTTTVTYSWN